MPAFWISSWRRRDYTAARQLVTDYQKQFPNDEIFPVKAKAMVEYRQGSLQQGLGVYEQGFQPLWAPELVKSYFDLLAETQSLRKFLDQSRAALTADPEDLNAMARSFSITTSSRASWTSRSKLSHLFGYIKTQARRNGLGNSCMFAPACWKIFTVLSESARYYFALYNSKGMKDAQEQALAGLTNLLLTAPESPIRLGSGELSMYRDIARIGDFAVGRQDARLLPAGAGRLRDRLFLTVAVAHRPEQRVRLEERSASPIPRRACPGSCRTRRSSRTFAGSTSSGARGIRRDGRAAAVDRRRS